MLGTTTEHWLRHKRRCNWTLLTTGFISGSAAFMGKKECIKKRSMNRREFSERPRIALSGLQNWLIVLPPRGRQQERARFSAPLRNDRDRVGSPLTILRSFMLHLRKMTRPCGI